MGITISCQHFENTRVDSQQCDIEGTTSKIEDEDIRFSTCLVHTIRNCCSGRFVDNSFYFHTRNSTSIFGSLTLSIVEISWNSNDGIFDFLTQKCFCGCLHFLKDHSRNFFWSVRGFLSCDSDLDHWLILIGNNIEGNKFFIGLNRLVGKLTPNQSLDVKDSIFRINSSLIFSGISYETFGVIHKSNVRRSDAVTLVVRNDFNASILKYSHTRICGSEINTDSGSH
mmetsp:Transcript_58371/g.65348  ORF Transcript_58371/g.65348 Transcript_58371/m.65348 type:complete len:226 (+) Transcript_58371:1326-2003(+)